MSRNTSRFSEPGYRFPQTGWQPLTVILYRDDKTCRDRMLKEIRSRGIRVMKIPNEYLVDMADFLSKFPVEPTQGETDA